MGIVYTLRKMRFSKLISLQNPNKPLILSRRRRRNGRVISINIYVHKITYLKDDNDSVQ